MCLKIISFDEKSFCVNVIDVEGRKVCACFDTLIEGHGKKKRNVYDLPESVEDGFEYLSTILDFQTETI